ncbi:hypothetical protein ACQPXS_37600 [Streptomyces sp. CA-142005]|uniref:hypothetical protein n=1 Tax=Streptomyces sp. CA-142005 TaxID=3240052 RepID=UPI003D8AFF9D
MAGVLVRSTHYGIEDPIGLTPLPRDAVQGSDRGADVAAAGPVSVVPMTSPRRRLLPFPSFSATGLQRRGLGRIVERYTGDLYWAA